MLSIDSSLGSRLLVCRAPAPEDSADSAPGGPTALTVLFHCQEEDSRRHAESLGPMLARALADPAVASGGLDLVVAATGPAQNEQGCLATLLHLKATLLQNLA